MRFMLFLLLNYFQVVAVDAHCRCVHALQCMHYCNYYKYKDLDIYIQKNDYIYTLYIQPYMCPVYSMFIYTFI